MNIKGLVARLLTETTYALNQPNQNYQVQVTVRGLIHTQKKMEQMFLVTIGVKKQHHKHHQILPVETATGSVVTTEKAEHMYGDTNGAGRLHNS